MHACQIKLCITQNYTSLYHFKCPSITINSTVNYKSRNLTHHCISLGKYENIRNTRFFSSTSCQICRNVVTISLLMKRCTMMVHMALFVLIKNQFPDNDIEICCSILICGNKTSIHFLDWLKSLERCNLAQLISSK